jgi:hypothetical protein
MTSFAARRTSSRFSSLPALQRITRIVGLAGLLLLALGLIAGLAAAANPIPAPGKAVTQADVEAVLKGKFTSRSPEEGALFYEETGGPREVHVYLWTADGKNVAGLKPSLEAGGETVDEVPGIGAAAMYRPQSNEVDVEIAHNGLTGGMGGDLWLSISVHNVDKPAETKRVAIELAKRAAGRL